MNNNPANPDDDKVMCDCSGTTRFKILSLIDQGIDTLDGISRKTGAASGCGSCDYEIQSLIDEIANTKNN
jgi:NAD(P)H-nitrite reductase large subunit